MVRITIEKGKLIHSCPKCSPSISCHEVVLLADLYPGQSEFRKSIIREKHYPEDFQIPDHRK